MAKRKSEHGGQEFAEEAERLAQLPARERKEALAVHRRIADDTRLSDATRNYARYVADTLERHLRRLNRQKQSWQIVLRGLEWPLIVV
jgi:hypothetical protein